MILIFCRGKQSAHLRLDLSDCTSIQGLSLVSLSSSYSQASWLSLSGCSSMSVASLQLLAAPGAVLEGVSELRLSHLPALSSVQRHNEDGDALPGLLRASGLQLQLLHLDGSSLGDETMECLVEWCRELAELSIVGCTELSDAGLQLVARGCQKLRTLAVGGAKGTWSERHGLSCFQGLRSLSISRRSILNDQDFSAVMQRHHGLHNLRLAGCASITDAGLASLPADLRKATFICCDSVSGKGLGRLQALQELRFRDCTRVTAQAVQVRC